MTQPQLDPTALHGVGTTRAGIFDTAMLSRCISCGFCLTACPTYSMTNDEASSPRGRINLMRSLEAGSLPLTDPELVEQASQCLGCRACEPVCPAGVQYGQLLEQWRAVTWNGRRQPVVVRALNALVRLKLPLRLAGVLRRHAHNRPSAPGAAERPAAHHLMLGCVERVLFPAVSRAAARLAPELGVDRAAGCCGALHAHNGAPAMGEAMARELGRRLPGVIVTTSGGCAAHLSGVLGVHRVREFSDYLTGHPVLDRLEHLQVDGRRARVTFQDSCHLRNGLGISAQPRSLLARVADHVEFPDAGGCCGAAGTYSLVRRKESRRILAAKLDAIEAANVDLVVTVNPGCLRQLGGGLRRRGVSTQVVHLAELLAWTLRA